LSNIILRQKGWWNRKWEKLVFIGRGSNSSSVDSSSLCTESDSTLQFRHGWCRDARLHLILSRRRNLVRLALKFVKSSQTGNMITSFHRTTNKLSGFSPPANYTERATAACRRS
jgi:hypothetical protein